MFSLYNNFYVASEKRLRKTALTGLKKILSSLPIVNFRIFLFHGPTYLFHQS